MKTSTIINCFRKAKFIRAVDDALLIPTPNDNEIEIEDILDTLPYFEDNSLPICDMNADEGTVLDTLIENEDEDGDDEEEVKIIKETEVLKHFSELSRFLLNNGCDPNIIFEFKSIIFGYASLFIWPCLVVRTSDNRKVILAHSIWLCLTMQVSKRNILTVN